MHLGQLQPSEVIPESRGSCTTCEEVVGIENGLRGYFLDIMLAVALTREYFKPRQP